MGKYRGSRTKKAKAVLASLTVGALATVAKPALFSKVYAASNSFDWERQEDVDRLGGRYTSAARSANGTHLILGVSEGGENQGQGDPSPLYISGNSGQSWENVAPEIDSQIRHTWKSVDVSDDGQTMVAASEWGINVNNFNTQYGKIFVSENGGSTWADVSPAGDNTWDQVVVSGNGQKIVAIEDEDIHVSENGGDSWTTPDTEEFWNILSVSVSDDGGKIFIGGENSSNSTARLYVSQNNGTTWVDKSPDSADQLYNLEHDVSSDGTKIVAATRGWNGNDTDAVFVSDDGGETWTENAVDSANINQWRDAAISDDGTTLSVIDNDGGMFVSNDSGVTWNEEDPGQEYDDPNDWQAIDFNDDGSKAIAIGNENAYITAGAIPGPGATSIDFANSENGKAVQLTLPNGTTITCHTAVKESSLSASDANYQYPLGLVDFCFDTENESNQIILTFVTDLKPADIAVRKYNSTTKAYGDVPGTSVTETTHNGQHALQVTYTIVDNGPLDLDPDLGEIADPVGIGVAPTSATSLANTGSSASVYLLIAVTTVGTSLALAGSRKFFKQSRH